MIRGSCARFPSRSKDFFFASCGSLIPFTRANAQWVIHGFNQHFNLHFRVNSLFHYLCSPCYAAQHSCVPLLPLRCDSPPKSSPTFSVRPRSSVGRVTVDLIRGSWAWLPPRFVNKYLRYCINWSLLQLNATLQTDSLLNIGIHRYRKLKRL